MRVHLGALLLQKQLLLRGQVKKGLCIKILHLQPVPEP